MSRNIRKRLGETPNITKETIARKKRRSLVRGITFGTFSLVLLAGVTGLVYTWYIGQQKNPNAFAQPQDLQKRPSLNAPKVNPNAPVNVSLQSISTPVSPGDNIILEVRTNPKAICDIVVDYGGVTSTDSGIKQKTADDFGTISWSWTIEPSIPTGSYQAETTCKNKSMSGVLLSDFVVE